MLVAGIVISAVAMFLGLITKLPQGGGVALTFFLPAPPLPHFPSQNRILFDLETAIAENQLYYLSNPVVTRNGTYGPMPRPLCKLSSSAADNATFTFPTFDSSAFSLPRELIQFWASIGTAIIVFMTLCLPWLVIKKMNILGMTGPVFQAAGRTTVTGFGALVTQIEPLNPLLEDLRVIISERDQASANLWSISKQAREAEIKATEKDAKKEEAIAVLCAERNKALKELEEEKEKVAKAEEEKKKEVDGLRGETCNLVKAWTAKAAKLEEERKCEVDGLREEISRGVKSWEEKLTRLEEEKKKVVDELQEEASGQTKIWTEKEKEWEVERADEKQRHNEAINGLKMSRERETESWRKQVEDLERAKGGAKEAFGAQLTKMVEKMKKEREGWDKVKEAWKEEIAKEKEEWEEKRIEDEKSWAEANDRAQRRITELEAENDERQKQAAEAEAEKNQGQKHAEEEANKSIAKLEKEVLNGRKLIEDLQADKRRDRQLLLELRAQLVRPTHFAPPHHMNPFRFGGTAPPPFMGGSIDPGPSAFPTTAPSAFSPITSHPAFPIGNPPSDFTPHTATPLPFPTPSAPPIVRLPRQLPPNLAQPPPNAPKGPKGWCSGPTEGSKSGQ